MKTVRRDGLEAGCEACVIVRIVHVDGSAPRDPGAHMLVYDSAVVGTIGGGRLEFDAVARAREVLGGGPDCVVDVALGPEIGQCCGGRVTLDIRRVQSDDGAAVGVSQFVYIFGAGHVGRSLANVLDALPVEVRLIDDRAEFVEDPEPLPEAVVRAAAPCSALVITTYEHATDFLIVEEVLRRGDAAYVGMIGSSTKRSVLEKRLREAGLDPAPLICPIGSAGLGDKRPEMIALHTAAEIYAVLSR